MYPLLLAVLLSVFSPEPLANTPPLDHFAVINLEWDTHIEGWDKVFALEVQHPGTYAEQTSDNPDTFRGMGGGWEAAEEYRPLIAGQFPWDQVDNAICVVVAESGANPAAKNPRSSARGLFQVLASLWSPYFGFSYNDLYVPELNVYAAARIWEMDGWGAWSPRTRRLCGL